MTEPDTVLAIWKARITGARAALEAMAEAPRLTPAGRAAVEQFFNEVEQLAEESEDDDRLRNRLAALLTGVANGLKGQPAPLSSHDWSDLPVKAETARAEIKDLHYQLAAETLRADQGWERYRSANDDRNDVRARVAELEAVWFDPPKLHVNLLRSGYPRDLALHLAGATDYDSMAAQLKAIKEHTSGFACWWGMTEAQEELAGSPIKDEHAILHFMGSGASTMVTAREIRRMLDTIYGMKGLAT